MGECGQAAFMAFLFWFSVGNSFITYYVSSMNDWAVWVDGVDNDLVNLFGILLALTVFFGPSAGIIIDAITSRLSNVSFDRHYLEISKIRRNMAPKAVPVAKWALPSPFA